MLFLVCAYGDKVCLIKKNISRHKCRVCKQTCVDVVCVLCGFILELCHTGKLAELCVAVKNPCHLCMCGNVALNKENALFGVNTASKDRSISLQHVLSHCCRLLTNCDCVQVCKGVDAVLVFFVLHNYPVTKCAEVIAQSDGTRGLDSAVYNFLFLCICCLHNIFSLEIKVSLKARPESRYPF